MSEVSFELSASNRQTTGKAAARRMRYQKRVPAVIYGAGQEPQPISLDHNQILHALEHEAFYSHILTVEVDGKSEKVVLKSLQRHSSKPQILHVDFQRIRAKEKLTMMIPIHYLGEDKAAGLEEGGVISKLITEVEIRCLPADLPEYLEIDVSDLHMGESLHLSHLKLPSGVEFIHEIDEAHDQPIVSMHQPKVSQEALEEEVAAEEALKAAEEEAKGEGEEGTEEAVEGEVAEGEEGKEGEEQQASQETDKGHEKNKDHEKGKEHSNKKEEPKKSERE